MFYQGTLTEGVAYPAVVTLIVEHSDNYWACEATVIGNHGKGFIKQVTKQELEKAGGTHLGAPLVLIKIHGRIQVIKAPKGSENIVLDHSLHITQKPYPRQVYAKFPQLKHDTQNILRPHPGRS